MQLFVDYLPILAFFGAYFYERDFYFATIVLMIAMPIVLLLQWLLTKKFNKIYVASTVLVLVAGTATVLLKNPLFLIWKPTVLNWAIGVAFLGSQFIGDKTFVERMMGEAAKLEKPQWHKLNLMWVAFFLVVGTVNLYVGYNYSEEIWVEFKLFGMLGLTLVFVILQTIWLTLVMSKSKSEAE